MEGAGSRTARSGLQGGIGLEPGYTVHTLSQMAAERHREEQQSAQAAGAAMQLASENELWKRFARDRKPAIREELIRRNMPFAKRLALRYRGASESFDDLLQVANLGLLNAIDRFDPERGIPFTAFASPTILGELKRHFRDRVWTVRVPRGLHDRMAEVDKAITELTKQLQRSPSVGEIAARLEVEQTDVLEVMEANHNRRPLSLDRPASSDDSDESAPTEWIGEEDHGFELVEGRIALDSALPHLDDRERLVLRLRFVEDMTQSQIADRIGHSQMHVSRILRRALARIREQIREQQSE
jgi:RNA polymerase sigma-B factor